MATEGAAEGPRLAFASLPRTEQRELIRRAILRPVMSAVLLLVVYFVVPMNDIASVGAIGALVLCAVLVSVLFVWQVRRIVHAKYPAVQSVEALAVTVPTYLLVVATIYHLMSLTSAGSFNEPLSRLDALYFSLVCFSTVGFGDIVAETEVARAVVTAQIVFNLVLLGIGVKVITAAVRAGQRRRGTENA
ncbi:conserved membrane hypothetical protein [Rhodococcus sp. RD6.2]|jgi:hypothetical protein|uniref:potassium channel family protein n=1 Tax=Rhodococcus sp. RD6.2 TaxID=260936 RepID=UPI00063B16AB|nr:potassium channel family protein [Rhodococcus sp. RD6.2]CRK49946.1 conserved membrane hypothetical protein [Rhodococcus sp. RD6.2]